MKYLCTYSLLLFLLVCFQASATAKPVPQFKSGDRVCFIGDSITHGGSYHSNVYLYYLTRFPERKFRIWNKGISGNQASHVLQRFQTDIASESPTVSTLMLGMNDVGRWLYGTDKTDPTSLKYQASQLKSYYTNMRAVVEKLEAIGSEVIFITPSIYDQTAELERANNFGTNDALAQCASFIDRTAAVRAEGYVDFYYPMLEINTQLQRADPKATIVGNDRVHPSWDPGHFVMAYQFLKAQAVPKLVSKVVLDARYRKVLEVEQATVSQIQSKRGSFTFTVLESALPFPQTESISKGLALVPFEEEMNQQILSIQSLPDGDYTLTIDSVKVGSWSAKALKKGINLASVETTPQFQQALSVKALNDERAKQEGRLRSAALVYYGSGLYQSDVDLEDNEAVQAVLDARLETFKGEPWHGYMKQQYRAYLPIKAEENDIHASLNSLQQKLYQANQPVAHCYQITRSKSGEGFGKPSKGD
ncbi:MAG: Acetylxylan esterase [Opitutia bacterium UBA7350]|nr:MAG: Acetylxylan esterase [Opitutae bacterium UBA7350]